MRVLIDIFMSVEQELIAVSNRRMYPSHFSGMYPKSLEYVSLIKDNIILGTSLNCMGQNFCKLIYDRSVPCCDMLRYIYEQEGIMCSGHSEVVPDLCTVKSKQQFLSVVNCLCPFHN